MLHNRFLLLDDRAKQTEQGLKEPCFYVILTIIMLKIPDLKLSGGKITKRRNWKDEIFEKGEENTSGARASVACGAGGRGSAGGESDRVLQSGG